MRRFVGTTAKLSAGFWDEVARLAGPASGQAADPTASASNEEEPTPQDLPEQSDAAETEAPSAGVLVPLDTWTRVMDQLGNLHEAGQQLAEARERAARAETQVEFLREQLADTRRDLETSRRRPPKQKTTPQPTPAQADDAPLPIIDSASPGSRRVQQARARLGDWLRPS